MPRVATPEIGLTIRLGLALATLALGTMTHQAFVMAPWVLAVASVNVLIVILLRWRRDLHDIWAMVALAGLTVLATVAMEVIDNNNSFLLLVIAALHAGVRLGWIGALVTGWACLTTAFLMDEFTAYDGITGPEIVISMIVGSLIALIAALWHIPAPSKDTIAAEEARELLIRLGSLADSLETGFDIPALGDATLEEIADTVSIERGAVIMRNIDDAVPVSLRGLRRMPWPAPSDTSSALNRTWEHGLPARDTHLEGDVWFDTLVVPLKDAMGSVIGLIALDRRDEAFTVTDQSEVMRIAQRAARLFEVGMLFSRLRGRAALEERTRLARDMHDGVAQELAALSFSVNLAVQQAPDGSPIRASLESLRTSMRQSLTDIRHQISTLQMVERPSVSLGAILSSTLQSFGTQTGLRTTMTIDETRFRFPAHIEVQLHRLALDFINDARVSGATWVDWEISLSAPNADLVLIHDGDSSLTEEFYAKHTVTQRGQLIVDSLIPKGHYVHVSLGTDTTPEDLGGSPFLDDLELAEEHPGTTIREHAPAWSGVRQPEREPR